MTTLLKIILGLILWIMLGFIGFLIEANEKRFTSFNDTARREFLICIVLGAWTFCVFGCIKLDKFFTSLMNKILSKNKQ